MSGTDSDTQEQKTKVSRLAIGSLLLSVFGGCLLVLILYGFGTYGFIGQYRMPFYLRPLYVYGHLVSGLMVIAGIVVGIVAIKEVRNKHQILKGGQFAISGIVISVVFLFVWIWHNPSSPFIVRKRCAANLRSLGTAMLIYTTGDCAMPADKWCDLLVEGGCVESEKQFRCPATKKGRCHYAINPNASPRSHPRLVLLFETKGGWNQFGGPELLTAENHKGKGCNIVFNDLHTEWVTPDRFGQLKWGEEDSQVKRK
ncbi:MAG: DUF4190 domain-containing protein [Planctomycetota bacterium]|jgi:hypothetical protein